MILRLFEQSNQVVSQQLKELANQDREFKEHSVTIGTKNFNMKVNIKKEQRKMKESMRKIGDMTGVGFDDKETGGGVKSGLLNDHI